MERTPIRVRGRRKRKIASDSPDSSPNTTPRPRKVARFNFAGLQPLKTKKIRRDPNLSYLEQLPTELIQVIFECCKNISMPLSSFVLRRKLSHRNIYLGYALNVLSVPVTGQSTDTEADQPPDTEVDQPADAPTVSRLLQCKWMTWPILKTTILALHDRTQFPLPDPDIPLPNFTAPHLQPTLPYLNLTTQTQIPEKLLQSPWTEEKTEYLNYLIWSDCSIDWQSSSRGELATSGLQTAIATSNELISALLLSPQINVVPDTQTLRTALITHNANPTILFSILTAALRASILSRAQEDTTCDFNFRDPAVWSWCTRAVKAGNGKGSWLLEALRFAGDMCQRRSVWDGEVFGEFRRVFGREDDGVGVLDVPVV